MKERFDLEKINLDADLLAIIGKDTHLEKIGSKEYAGACPFPGCHCKKDGFKVQPAAHRWLCHNCTDGQWRNALHYVAMRDNLNLKSYQDLKTAVDTITGGNVPTTSGPRREPEPQPAAVPPGESWQAAGLAFVEASERELWAPGGARALDYLHKRGLQDETIKRFRLGFHPEDKYYPAASWGLEETKDFRIDKGVVIPCFVHGRLWYVKIRRKDANPKYRCIKGSKPVSIFNADDMAGRDVALFVEGEFDCMIAWQELRGLVPVVTLGSANNRPDLATWGRYFVGKRAVLLAYDLDTAGEKGAAALAELSSNSIFTPLPAGQWKDINDFYLAGGNLRGWVSDNPEVTTPEPGGLVDELLTIGAVIADIA